MIKTSYFARYSEPDAVSIALYTPNFWKGECYQELAPTQQILEWWKSSPQGVKEQNIYRKLYYRDVLNRLDVHAVARALEGKTLLCYEKTGCFCHRHLVSEWLSSAGYQVQETVPPEAASPEQEKYLLYGKLYELFGNDLEII